MLLRGIVQLPVLILILACIPSLFGRDIAPLILPAPSITLPTLLLRASQPLSFRGFVAGYLVSLPKGS